jgi:hypothetical protein
MNVDDQFTPESLGTMMSIMEMVRSHQADADGDAFSRLGVRDTRSFLIGLISGALLGIGAPYEFIIQTVMHPNVQAMLDGCDPNL